MQSTDKALVYTVVKMFPLWGWGLRSYFADTPIQFFRLFLVLQSLPERWVKLGPLGKVKVDGSRFGPRRGLRCGPGLGWVGLIWPGLGWVGPNWDLGREPVSLLVRFEPKVSGSALTPRASTTPRAPNLKFNWLKIIKNLWVKIKD